MRDCCASITYFGSIKSNIVRHGKRNKFILQFHATEYKDGLWNTIMLVFVDFSMVLHRILCFKPSLVLVTNLAHQQDGMVFNWAIISQAVISSTSLIHLKSILFIWLCCRLTIVVAAKCFDKTALYPNCIVYGELHHSWLILDDIYKRIYGVYGVIEIMRLWMDHLTRREAKIMWHCGMKRSTAENLIFGSFLSSAKLFYGICMNKIW